ncbi:MAG TPA: bifunctional hydroxymethylpyrimidine kinase/phosphomethylpyrimidine kinase [Candidatus Cybelea sp.]|jgi:hydroxymethylpyrimidine/phosphomethylpyrimidine kinase|nr:bifunctional hydroxymethylpyrimidine kinase/phosphomethylpyrimidine kinase [Candidatus Cybelea sp.]
MRNPHEPVVLTIAGSDSGGEAGLQADLKTFALLRVHGTCVITCVTAQNRKTVARLEPCSPRMVRAQLESVAAALPLSAAKTGMLFSAAIVREVAAFFQEARSVPLVLDPVIISTSGRRLLQRAGVVMLQKMLLPLATLVTPNIAEAEVLSGKKITNLEDMRAAARKIQQRFGCAALVKGGHLSGTREAVDFLCSGEGEWMFTAPRAKVKGLHGTGCTYSAAITAWLAHGRPLHLAVKLAKDYITRTIAA